MSSTPIHALPRPVAARSGGRALFTLSLAALCALAGALPADGQAARSRPSGGTTAGTASGGSGKASAAAPAPASGTSASANAGSTRPGTSSGGRTVVERDARAPRGGGSGGGGIFVSPWGWWHPYSWGYGWGGWYGGYYGPYGPYGGYGPAWYPRRMNDRMGALDLDLKPGDTEIWLDGQLIGVADRFDGWPGYLWLEEGDYHFVFFREGFRTIAREYRIRRGLVIDVEDRLEPGESVPAEELVPPQPTPRRDARIRRNEDMRRRAAEAAEARREAAAAAGDDDALLAGEEGSDWRDRAPAGDVAEDAGVGTLRLAVVPADASVYLDGRFLGTGADVGRLRRGLAVPAGEHQLEVVRPGHAPVARQVVLADGEELEIEIVLEPR